MATSKAKTTFKNVPVDKLLLLAEEGRKAVEGYYQDNWDAAKQMYDGDQWNGIDKIAWFQSEPVYNKVFEFVEIMRAYLSDSKWGLDIFPLGVPADLSDRMRQEQDKVASTDNPQTKTTAAETISTMTSRVNDVLDFVWEDTNMNNKLAQVLLLIFLYGTGFLKVRFNTNNISATGIGQIEVDVLSPRHVYADPYATSVKDASYIIEKHPVTMRWVYENFPDMYQAVKDDMQVAQSKLDWKGSQAPSAPTQDWGESIDILECWYKDSAVVDDTEELGSTIKPGTKLYPTGRYTLMTSNKIVLDDKANPYTMYPYVRFVELPRPGEFWGDATIWRAISIQQNINTLLRSIIDNGLWMAHGIWIADTNSGLTADSFAGYGPRAVIFKNPGTKVERDTGASIPQGIFQTLEQQVTAFDRVVGLPDVLRGEVPSRQPVGTVQMQKEAGDVRTRERQRRVEESLADLGQIWLDMIQEFWADNRTIKTTSSTAGYDMFQFSKQDLADWRFSLKVIPGSTTSDGGDALDKLINLRTQANVPVSDEYIADATKLPGLTADVIANKRNMQAELMAQQNPQAAPPEQSAQSPTDATGQPITPDQQAQMDAQAQQLQAQAQQQQ